MKYRQLTGEYTKKEIEEMKSERKAMIECSSFDVKFSKDPNHEFRENTSYFANPSFSTLKRNSCQRRAHNRSIQDGKLKIPSLKRKRKNAIVTVNDFENILLLRQIEKGRRLSSIPNTLFKDRLHLKNINKSQVENNSINLIPKKGKIINNLKSTQSCTEKIIIEKTQNKMKFKTNPNSVSSSDSISPITKYLRNEKGQLLNELIK